SSCRNARPASRLRGADVYPLSVPGNSEGRLRCAYPPYDYQWQPPPNPPPPAGEGRKRIAFWGGGFVRRNRAEVPEKLNRQGAKTPRKTSHTGESRYPLCSGAMDPDFRRGGDAILLGVFAPWWLIRQAECRLSALRWFVTRQVLPE